MSKSIYIYGASGHGLVVADVAKSCGYEDIVFLDDDNSKGFLTFEDIKENRDYHIAFGIGSNQIREKLYKKVRENGFAIPTLIHPSSIISSSARIEEGTVVGNGLYLGGNFQQAVEAVNNGIITQSHLKIFVGYTGWDTGDIEAEIEEGSWLVLPEASKDVFMT